MLIKTDLIVLQYVCPSCGKAADQMLTDLVDSGTLDCECGSDMILQDRQFAHQDDPNQTENMISDIHYELESFLRNCVQTSRLLHHNPIAPMAGMGKKFNTIGDALERLTILHKVKE